MGHAFSPGLSSVRHKKSHPKSFFTRLLFCSLNASSVDEMLPPQSLHLANTFIGNFVCFRFPSNWSKAVGHAKKNWVYPRRAMTATEKNVSSGFSKASLGLCNFATFTECRSKRWATCGGFLPADQRTKAGTRSQEGAWKIDKPPLKRGKLNVANR